MLDKVSTTRYNRAPRFFGKGRTRFDLSHSTLFTGNTGDLIVTLCEPIVPGSTMSLKTASLTRLETSLHQTLDNAYVETAYFFVPARILWSNFDKYQGYNQDAWARTLEYTKPQYYFAALGAGDGDLNPLDNYVLPHSLINDLYAPIGAYNIVSSYSNYQDLGTKCFHVDQLPLRGVFKIYNDYFRDQNYDSEIYWGDGDEPFVLANVLGSQPSASVLFNGANFRPNWARLKVNRFKDLMSTALPQPEKGDPVSVLLNNQAPVGFVSNKSGTASSTVGSYILGSGDSTVSGEFINLKTNGNGGISEFGGNIVANLSSVNFTVNDLRIAIALQSMRERDARSGNRLNEKLYGTWHIQTNDIDLDRAEYLGGKRIPVSMMEVLQTSETGTTVLGTSAGYSKTIDTDDSFVKTFTQWGYVIGFVWVRTSRSYSQGIDRKFFVEDILDEYDPMLDSISEQPIYKKELNAVLDLNGAGNTVAKGNKVFGYQEPWYQYKERTNRFYGMFQPGISGTLDSWHYGDDYRDSNGIAAEVFASPSWLKEDSGRVDRTIAVASDASLASFQWKFNMHFELYNTFEASKKSIPNTFGF